MENKFDKKQLAFIEAVATGAKLYEAYIEAYGGEGLAIQTIKNRARKVMTAQMRTEIEKRRAEYEAQSARQMADACEIYESETESFDFEYTGGTITRERLLSECDFVMRKAKPCISKVLNGVPIINRDAANVYLKAIETSAKIIGAFVPEEKTDNVIEIIMPAEIKELAN